MRHQRGSASEPPDLDTAMEMIADRECSRHPGRARRDADAHGNELRRTMGMPASAARMLDNEDILPDQKNKGGQLFSALGAIQIETRARI